MDNQSNVAYYIYNGHGDVVDLISPLGVSIITYDYDAFGNILEEDGTGFDNPFKFAGELLDSETGYYIMGARYYAPSLGRWISEDAYRGDISDPLSLNLYVFVGNNPLIYVDPSGYAPWSSFSIFNRQSLREVTEPIGRRASEIPGTVSTMFMSTIGGVDYAITSHFRENPLGDSISNINLSRVATGVSVAATVVVIANPVGVTVGGVAVGAKLVKVAVVARVGALGVSTLDTARGLYTEGVHLKSFTDVKHLCANTTMVLMKGNEPIGLVMGIGSLAADAAAEYDIRRGAIDINTWTVINSGDIHDWYHQEPSKLELDKASQYESSKKSDQGLLTRVGNWIRNIFSR